MTIGRATGNDNENVILESIVKGMRVIDRNGDEIGKVDFVQMSAADVAGRGAAVPSFPGEANSPLLSNLAQAFVDDKLPEEVRERLLQNGFIRLSSNRLFSRNRYIIPDQISAIDDDRVILNVSYDELIKH